MRGGGIERERDKERNGKGIAQREKGENLSVHARGERDREKGR